MSSFSQDHTQVGLVLPRSCTSPTESPIHEPVPGTVALHNLEDQLVAVVDTARQSEAPEVGKLACDILHGEGRLFIGLSEAHVTQTDVSEGPFVTLQKGLEPLLPGREAPERNGLQMRPVRVIQHVLEHPGPCVTWQFLSAAKLQYLEIDHLLQVFSYMR